MSGIAKCNPGCVRTCRKCGEAKPYATWPRYAADGRLTVYCADCNAVIEARRVEIQAAKARGYRGACHTPEYKRKQLEAEAAKAGRSLPAYMPQAERERGHAMLMAETKADVIRRRFAKSEYRRLREIWWKSHKHSEEYRESHRVRYRAFYKLNSERERQRVVAYKHANPEKVAVVGDRRKQRAALYADGSLTRDQVGKLFQEAKRCPYCERRLDATNKSLDHLEPLSKGGAHALHNVLISCRDCNIRKHATPFAEWIKTLSVSCERRVLRIYRQQYGVEPEQAGLTLVWSATA